MVRRDSSLSLGTLASVTFVGLTLETLALVALVTAVVLVFRLGFGHMFVPLTYFISMLSDIF